MNKYRKIPVEISAVRWDGTDDRFAEIQRWTEARFRLFDGDGYSAEVHDDLHDTWVKLRTGDYIIRGLDGEFYPCEKSIFERSYETA